MAANMRVECICNCVPTISMSDNIAKRRKTGGTHHNAFPTQFLALPADLRLWRVPVAVERVFGVWVVLGMHNE